MNADIPKALRSIHLLAGLPAEYLDQLSSFTVLRSVRAGETIFCQGEPSPYCFGVVSGEVHIQRVSKDRRFPPKLLSVLGPGSLFGESALFAESPRAAMASASEDGQLVAILGTKFRDWVRQDGAQSLPLVMGMMQNALSRLHQTSSELAAVYGVGRLLAGSKTFTEQISEAMDFAKTSMDGIDEILFYQRSAYWPEFELIAGSPDQRGVPVISFESALSKEAHALTGPIALKSGPQREALVELKLPWENFAAVCLVPLFDHENAEQPLQGLWLAANYQNREAFSPNMLHLLSAVSQQFAESLARHRRHEDVLAKARLQQSKQSFTL